MKILQIILCLFLCSCSVRKPDNKEFAGTWKNANGTQFQLMSDMTFTAKSLPINLFLGGHTDSIGSECFDGSGTWFIEDWKFQFPAIRITFNSTSKGKLASCLLLVAGSGFFEYRPPWNTLFVWIEEEGGERFEFKRQLSK